MLAVAILNLSSHISFTWLVDDAERASRGGWVFSQSTGLDPVFGARDLRCDLVCPTQVQSINVIGN